MSNEVYEPSGFWSYVHNDDARVGGRILRLAARIRDEFSLITGQEIEVFVDRESIAWGDQWESKINVALQETTFFIPIITPSYFTSTACRTELMKFATYARSLGALDLLLPIYFVNVPGLDPENGDEAISLIAKTQYSDWRNLRLVDEASEAYGRAVNDLATRLAGIAEEYGARPAVVPTSVVEPTEPGEPMDEPGLADRLAELESDVPALTECLESFTPLLEEIQLSVGEATEGLNATTTFAQRILVARGLASALFPQASEFLEAANTYSSLLIHMDPGVRAMIVMAAEQTGEDEIASAAEAVEALRALIFNSRSNEEAFKAFIDSLKGPSRQFKDLRPALGQLESGMRSMLDAHTVMDEWERLLREMPPGSLGGE